MLAVGCETIDDVGVSDAAVVVSGKNFMPSTEWRTLAGRLLPRVLVSEGELTEGAAAPLSWVEPMVDILC